MIWLPAARDRVHRCVENAAGYGWAMSLVRWMDVPMRPVSKLETVVGGARRESLVQAAAQVRQRLADRAIWNGSSAAVGGGGAEKLQVLIRDPADLVRASPWGAVARSALFFCSPKRRHT